MNTVTSVVVGYDGSSESLAALEWAVEAASRRGETLVVTTVIDPRETPRGIPWPESYWDDLDAKAHQLLSGRPDVPARFERHYGHLVPTLNELASKGSMLVVGSHGHGLVGEILLGSVSQSAARHAVVPVVVVRPAQNAAAGRIVVGADGSSSSRRALDFACELAALTGDKVVALRAWEPTPVVAGRYAVAPAPPGETIEHAEAALGHTVDGLRVAHPGVDVEGELFRGGAERGLVDASANASLVVVGSRGHNAVTGALMGSVSTAVLRKAHCPIAVVH